MALLAFYGMVVAISLSGVMAPGPLTALTLARGRRDALAGFWINTGHAIAETPLILALLAGLGPFLESPAIYRAISLAGGGVLLWMGLNLIRGRPGGSPDSSAGKRGPVLEGIAMTAFNPYWLLWWLTVGAGLIARARAFSAGWIMAGMVALHLACDLAWGTFLSWAAHRGGGAFRPEGWRRVEIGCGGVLIAFGAYFLYEGAWKVSG
ncbi:MAG: LysE family translocator [Nitrospinota bacterium]